MVAQNNPALTANNQSKVKMALWKIIVLSVSLTIIAALITTIIVFACVKVNLAPPLDYYKAVYGIDINFNKNMGAQHDGSNTYGLDTEEAPIIVSKLNDGFTTSLLNSFTQGFNSKNKYEIKYQPSSSTSYETMKSNNKYALCFMFAADQTLTTAGGEVFRYTSRNDIFKYRQMVVILNDSNRDFGALEIWFITDTNNFTSSSVKMTAYGSFGSVLNYLDTLPQKKGN